MPNCVWEINRKRRTPYLDSLIEIVGIPRVFSRVSAQMSDDALCSFWFWEIFGTMQVHLIFFRNYKAGRVLFAAEANLCVSSPVMQPARRKFKESYAIWCTISGRSVQTQQHLVSVWFCEACMCTLEDLNPHDKLNTTRNWKGTGTQLQEFTQKFIEEPTAALVLTNVGTSISFPLWNCWNKFWKKKSLYNSYTNLLQMHSGPWI